MSCCPVPSFSSIKLAYDNLVEQVTSILEEQPNDLDAIQKAMGLQDNINGLYDRWSEEKIIAVRDRVFEE